jgi:hypothetical protein
MVKASQLYILKTSPIDTSQKEKYRLYTIIGNGTCNGPFRYKNIEDIEIPTTQELGEYLKKNYNHLKKQFHIGGITFSKDSDFPEIKIIDGKVLERIVELTEQEKQEIIKYLNS